MIEYASRAYHMTEPVEGWIRRAGERTQEVGLRKVGRLLIDHARAEADHHLMLVEDLGRLTRLYQETHEERLDPEFLIQRPPTPVMRDYIAMHESVIASPAPYRQVAIEREIEGLSVEVGPAWLAQCKRLLGPDILDSVQFLASHVELDEGHTVFNQALMERLLTERPDAVDALVEIGERSLSIYLEFMQQAFLAAAAGQGQPSEPDPATRPRRERA